MVTYCGCAAFRGLARLRVGVQHPLVPGLAGTVEGEAEAIGVRFLLEAMEMEVLLASFLSAVDDIATESEDGDAES